MRPGIWPWLFLSLAVMCSGPSTSLDLFPRVYGRISYLFNKHEQKDLPYTGTMLKVGDTEM